MVFLFLNIFSYNKNCLAEGRKDNNNNKKVARHFVRWNPLLVAMNMKWEMSDKNAEGNQSMKH